MYFRWNGLYFNGLDCRNQGRYWTLVKEHSRVVNAAGSELSALPGTAQTFAAARAIIRFLNNPDVSFHALIEPAQDAVRQMLATSSSL